MQDFHCFGVCSDVAGCVDGQSIIGRSGALSGGCVVLVLFTDFGVDGPYVGQMKMALHQAGIGARPIIDLMHDAPRFQPVAAGCLLAALLPGVPPGAVLVAVVDPGVGSDRRAAAVRVDGRWLVGPDNGLFERAARAATELEWWDIDWPLAGVSATFHGRDVFAPLAAMLARGEMPGGARVAAGSRCRPDGSVELAEVIYLDGYGNAFTGLSADALAVDGRQQRLLAHGQSLRWARTFSDVAVGEAFWYRNSLGLVGMAVNGGSAAKALGLAIGMSVSWALST